ncbi:MAG: peptidase, partial [Gemmatimonas sp. SM23_52]
MRGLTRSIAVVTLVCSGAAAPLPAQSPDRPIPYPVVPSPQFRLAIENGTRTTTGVPGPNYWQQWTDYSLRARLLPDEKRLEGSGRIVYHNRSPDPLAFVVLQLPLNLHSEGAARQRSVEISGGIELKRIAVAGEELPVVTRRGQSPGYAVEGTTLPILLPRPLKSGDSVELEIDWAFRIPQRGCSSRLGWNEDNLFHLAYWYPQMAVYDDVVGWQADQFLGSAEFYMGYGSYDFTVEAPDGWVVMGTGALQNPEEVLPSPVLERYRRAHTSDEVVHVLSESDFGPGVATQRSEDGYLSWRFHADTVRDVAFSAMRESLWNAARTPVGDRDGDGVTDYALINSFYRASSPLWREQCRYAQHSIAFLSRWTGYPYPWPQMTSVEGGGIIGGGMEYPMMTLMGSRNAPEDTDTSLYGLTAHELAHSWVPMIVGTDERRHSWMDEGTTSFNDDWASAVYWSGPEPVAGKNEEYLSLARRGLEGEIMRRSDYHYTRDAYGVASYSKPAGLLNTLRALLGAETFERAYHRFIRTWAYKHPEPWDLFNLFSSESGMDLDWFWRTWYYETWTLDQAVGSLRADADGTTIIIEDRGWAPMPARVTITLADGEILSREVPVEVWLNGKTSAELRVPPGSPVVRVEIDAENGFPDIDRV